MSGLPGKALSLFIVELEKSHIGFLVRSWTLQYVYTIFCCTFHQLVDIGFPCFGYYEHFAMNVVYKFLCGDVYILFGHIPKSGIAWSFGNYTFNVFRNCQTVFQRDCIILHSHQHCMRVPVFVHSHQHLLLSFLKKNKL